jgi:hypothetical protein
VFYWIYDLSLWSGTALFAIVFISITWLLIVIGRPLVRRTVEKQPNWAGVIGSVLSAFGLFYGVTLALVVLSSYEDYAAAGAAVGREAAALGTLYRDVSSYPEPVRNELQEMLRVYTRDAIEKDWPAQRRGIVPEGGTVQATAFQKRLLAFEPQTRVQEIVHAETLREFSTFVEYRRHRLHNVRVALPVILWVVMFMGALLYMVLIALLDVKSLAVHLFVAGIPSLFVSLLIFITVAMDNPFRGDLYVSPRAFQLVQESLMGSP